MLKLFYSILLSLIFLSSSYSQSSVTLTAKEYNAIVLRGRELQTQLANCIASSKYFMSYIPALEAVIKTDTQLLDIVVPMALENQQNWFQRIKANLKPFLKGVLVGVIVSSIAITAVLMKSSI